MTYSIERIQREYKRLLSPEHIALMMFKHGLIRTREEYEEVVQRLTNG